MRRWARDPPGPVGSGAEMIRFAGSDHADAIFVGETRGVIAARAATSWPMAFSPSKVMAGAGFVGDASDRRERPRRWLLHWAR